MENVYAVKVNGDLDVQLSEEDIINLDVLRTSEDALHILRNGVSYHIKIVKADFRNRLYHIKVNGTEHRISIGTPIDMLIQKMGFATNGSKNINSVSAPMPGLILEISIKEGDEVAEGDQLLILEAMKMENSLTAPRDGIIKKISVIKGQAVEKKQLLIEFQ